ncbi:DUF2927 domain-containing protein [uncultured Maribacter sp.]|uniref:DUF2927 domain-containing protein n=1 Tax=uncultured Maribacter sp. TaxID=431308 RepID=UPI0026276A88|nr:DUF2927 domain-containing protein [uncultured Maribacter sp.]
MNKLILPAFAIFITSCSSDFEAKVDDIVNIAPVITTKKLQTKEHTTSGTSIGTIVFSDKNKNDKLTISTNSDAFIVNEKTGEVTVGPNTILDYEDTSTLTFTVSVSDGLATTEQEILLTLEDINEFDTLDVNQKELTSYFSHLALNGRSNNLTSIQKWDAPMKIFLDGNITTEYKATVQNILDEFNALFDLGDFSISLVDTLAEANTHLYLSNASEIEELWADIFAVVGNGSYNGYQISTENNSILSNSRIWVADDIASTFKHQLGHALGLGHSNNCNTEISFMCSNFLPGVVLSDEEKEIIRLLYHNDIIPGTTDEELNDVVSNLILLGQ